MIRLLKLVSLAAMCIGTVFAANAKKPNVVFVIADQHNWKITGAYGDKLVKTPNMDKLAKQGVIFDNVYSQYPLCGPSRACFFTGQYPQTHGAWFNGRMITPYAPKLSLALKTAGYKTGTFGIVDFEPRVGKYHGWDEYCYKAGHTKWALERGVKDPNSWQSGEGHMTVGVLDYDYKLHHDYWAVEQGCLMMEKWAKEDQPFFIRIGMRLPHPPYWIPKGFEKMYNPEDIKLPKSVVTTGFKLNGKDVDEKKLKEVRWGYYSMVSFVDTCLGKVLDTVDKLGIADNTIVIYTADHGNLMGEHGLMGKQTLYQEDVKLPFIMRWPGQPKAGIRSGTLYEQIDVMPTILEICGVEIPRGVQGKSMLPALQNPKKGKQAVFAFERHDRQMVFDGRYKMILMKNDSESLLFDLEKDPLEMNNLYGKKESQEITWKLKNTLLDWHLNIKEDSIPDYFKEPTEAKKWAQKYLDIDPASEFNQSYAVKSEPNPKKRDKEKKNKKADSGE